MEPKESTGRLERPLFAAANHSTETKDASAQERQGSRLRSGCGAAATLREASLKTIAGSARVCVVADVKLNAVGRLRIAGELPRERQTISGDQAGRSSAQPIAGRTIGARFSGILVVAESPSSKVSGTGNLGDGIATELNRDRIRPKVCARIRPEG